MHSGQTLSSQRPPLLQRLITPNPLSSLMKQIILGTTDSRPRGGELAHYLNFCEDMQLWALAHAFLVLDDHIMAGVVGGWEAADSLLGLDVQCLLHTLVSPMCCSATKKKYDGPKVVDFKAELTRRGRLGEPCKNLDVICFSFKNVFVRFGM